MKLALVKQDVYQDLYVGDKSMSPLELLCSSAGRVGPISLFDEYDCDFYIVEEEMCIRDSLNALNLQTELRRALLHYDIKKRYEWFLKEYSEINGKISGRYIASFLNMTPESLSRVKKELQGEKESNIKSGETNEKETG